MHRKGEVEWHVCVSGSQGVSCPVMSSYANLIQASIIWKRKKKERERESRVFSSPPEFFWLSLQRKKMWNPIDLAASWVPPGFFFFLGIVMLKLNELKPLLNLPQSRLHQPSGCDLGALALWCQIWKFSLPLKNEQKHKNKLPLISCITMLATLS